MVTQLKRKFNCLILEEDGAASLDLLQRMGQLDHFEVVGTCNSFAGLFLSIRNLNIDLVLAHATCLSASDLDDLKQASPGTSLILLVDHPDVSTPVDEHIYDCLVKPLNESRLLLSLQRFADRFLERQQLTRLQQTDVPKSSTILVKSGGKEVGLHHDEIFYIEADGEYVKYHTAKGRYMMLGSLRRLGQTLGENFIQVHRSYVVNRSFVLSKTRKNLELVGKRIIPIGRTYKDSFQFRSTAVLA